MCKPSILHTSRVNDEGCERSEGFCRIEFFMTNKATHVQMENKTHFPINVQTTNVVSVSSRADMRSSL